MSGPGQQQVYLGEEQLNLELEADFEELVESITKTSVKKVLARNKVKLVRKAVVNEEALQGLTEDKLVAYGLYEADAAALKVAFPTPTLAGAGGAAGVSDESADHMMEMVANMPPVALPRTSAEFEALINGTAGLRIPIPSQFHTDLAAQLAMPLRAALRSVPNSYAASVLHHVIKRQPTDVGSEQTTTCCLFDLLDNVNTQLSVVWSGVEGFKLQLNRTEKQAGSTSAATPDRTRPDTLIIHSSCSMLLGEDKVPGQLDAALADLEVYAKGGLNPRHNGNICGLPAYAASGFLVQFCFITQGGHVEPAGPVLDLATVAGRLRAVICVINLYRLLLAMSKALPPLVSRRPLWCPFFHGSAEITLTPLGAIKKIKDIKAHLRAAGTTKEALKRAYEAAATAAEQQEQQGQLPFLVCARDEDGRPAVPTFGARAGYTVRTTPLGYMRHIKTEEDARHVALACCKAARVLHEAGVVHSDFRLPNVVWLADSHCMVIDLEHTRFADEPVHKQLKDWVDATYDIVEDARCYTRRSEMHQIGRLVQQALPINPSPAAVAFVQALLDKSLTAEIALQHPWLQQQQPPP